MAGGRVRHDLARKATDFAPRVQGLTISHCEVWDYGKAFDVNARFCEAN